MNRLCIQCTPPPPPPRATPAQWLDDMLLVIWGFLVRAGKYMLDNIGIRICGRQLTLLIFVALV